LVVETRRGLRRAGTVAAVRVEHTAEAADCAARAATAVGFGLEPVGVHGGWGGTGEAAAGVGEGAMCPLGLARAPPARVTTCAARRAALVTAPLAAVDPRRVTPAILCAEASLGLVISPELLFGRNYCLAGITVWPGLLFGWDYCLIAGIDV